MKAIFRSSTLFTAVIGATVAAAVVGLNWQGVSMSAAALFAERRPALLRDARWGDASSARKFQERFRPGVPERELTSWLKENGFKVGPPSHASKMIGSVPCNEAVTVNWIPDSRGQLRQATVQVAEAGCL
jgi:hypothetical protein